MSFSVKGIFPILYFLGLFYENTMHSFFFFLVSLTDLSDILHSDVKDRTGSSSLRVDG